MSHISDMSHIIWLPENEVKFIPSCKAFRLFSNFFFRLNTQDTAGIVLFRIQCVVLA